MNLNYSIKLQKIAESDGETYYRLTIPKLPGVIAYGDTIDEGMKELEEAKKAWFTSCLQRNIKIPEPTKHHYSGKILLRMPKSLHAALAQEAEEENISLNSLIVDQLIKG